MEIARAADCRAALGLPGGQLIANPIPETDEIPRDRIMPVVEAALKAAQLDNIAAKSVTPYLLQKIYDLTNGQSLEANVALVLNNARLAAQIAVAHCALDAEKNAGS